jgi:hypothetical protein
LGAGGLLVTPIESEHPASQVAQSAVNSAEWKNDRSRVGVTVSWSDRE